MQERWQELNELKPMLKSKESQYLLSFKKLSVLHEHITNDKKLFLGLQK